MAPRKTIAVPTEFDVNKPIGIVDLSSFIFYRYFAIQRWLQASGNDGKLTQEQVLEKYEKLFESNLLDIKKKLKVDLANVILARDCPRDQIWRNEIYPEYKGGRDTSRPVNFDPQAFTRAYNSILPRLIDSHKFTLLQCDNAEADDIIAVVHNALREKAPETKIYVLSIDTDFVQLRSAHTSIYNFLFKDVTATIKEDRLENYLEWKIIKGDASDNISAIDKNIGDVTALKLAKDPKALEMKLKSSDAVREAHERNRILIDFDRIPMRIRENILNALASKIKV